jgi:transcriptional regulator with XRE-family HTH domain
MDRQETTGQRIARARRRRGLSQAALAGLIGRSESWLSQVERGKRRIDSHAVLTRMAEVLRVDIAELTESGSGDSASPRPYSNAQLIEQAMVSYTALEDSISIDGAARRWDTRNLQARITAAYCRYQATHYEETGRLLPALIRDTEAASRAAGPDHPELCRIRAHVYDTTAALLNRVGEHGLAWTAADRAIAAAEQSGQPLMTALGAYRLTYVLASRKHPREAIELAMTAASALDRAMRSSPPQPEQLSVYGGLHLAAANAAAARYDSGLSASLLRRAGQIAQRLGCDANLMGTAFVPVNVAIHTMSASARLGDWPAVVRLGESLDATAIPAGLIGRRTQVKLDLARAYAMRRQDAAAVNTLLAAEQLSPQLVRFDSATRDVLSGLLRREHRASTPQLRPLAHRAGLI